MASQPSGPGEYWLPLVGLILIGSGVAAIGTLLVVAGAGHGWVQSALLLGGAAVLLGAGYGLLTYDGRGKGGWRRATMSDDERQVYRAEFRQSATSLR